MKLYIIDHGKIKKYTLPNKIEEDFSISYRPVESKEEFLITLTSENNKWVLNSNGNVNIVDSNFLQGRLPLEDYGKCNLKIIGIEKPVTVYFIPNTSEKLYRLDSENIVNISVGSSPENNIYYRSSNVSKNHVTIIKSNEGAHLKINEDYQNFPVYLNDYQVFSNQSLNLGDVVFVEGLKIIWMNDFIEINNPNNLIQVQGLMAYSKLENEKNNTYQKSKSEEKNVELYKEKDYFYHTPRLKEEIIEEEILIDAPPAPQVKDDAPLILTIGSTITMAASSLMMGWNVGYGLISGTKAIIQLIPQIVMCVAMIVGSLILPKIAQGYQKRKQKQQEKLRQEKYTKYLKSKEIMISATIKSQEQVMRDNNLSIDECINAINTRNRNFWSHEISDTDFLSIRLGLGSCLARIRIKAPEEHFSLDTDNLLQNVYDMVEKHKNLTDVPISISLTEKNIVSFIFENKQKYKYIEGIIIQLIALQSPCDLKIVIITNEDNKDRWHYAKMLSHCQSDDKTQRFFSTTLEQAKELSNYLIEELKERKEQKNNKNQSEDKEEKIDTKNIYKNYAPYYLIITDDYSIAKETKIVEEVSKKSNNYGFSLLAIDDSMQNLPTQSEIFVNVGQNDGAVLERNISAKSQLQFKNEYNTKYDIDAVSKAVSNIPTAVKNGVSVLPSSLTFLEMYGVSKIEQLNILNRWKTNNPVNNLNAPIGVHASGEIFKLNLHEKFHGPHGLIAGSTGSGKSEFIITYILSMAVNYHPYEVQFVLIDYKGGGLAGAFENKETGVKLPHLTGTITNLDTSEMNRTLVSIQSELKRRQKKFNEVRDKLNLSTIDIYKYQQLYREGSVKEPMSHLFIISDEFAELKSQQPEFMQQLISTARIGRSLGVHLILATQKPSGVVNDQIWSNAKFKVCLKVQDRSDSMEMLKRPEAASIKEAGRFYLQVGYDDFFDIGQSGWSGAKYIPSDQIIKKVDDSINFIDNVGNIIKTINNVIESESETKDYGDQLTNTVHYICNLGKKENILTQKLWLDAIPAEIYLNDLKNKYNYKPTPYLINPLIGEYDNPINQEQGLVNLDLTRKGNTLIYGQNGSGKENILTTIIWSTIIEHTPDEVSIYILDYGAETLRMFNKIPHVGEVLTADDSEKVIDAMNMINDEIERRKDLFADYGGSYIEYNNNNTNKLPLIVAIINNYEIFCENNSKLSENIQSLYRDGSKYGVVFIITAIATNAVRTRMAQNFENKICLQIANDDYRSVLKAPKGLVPSKIFGRGLIEMNDTAYEFQTAIFVKKQNLIPLIKEASQKLSQAYTTRAKKVPSLPQLVTINNVGPQVGLNSIPIGYDIDTKQQFNYNFINNKINQIITNAMNEDKMNFLYAIVKLLSKLTNVTIIDAVDAIERNIENVRVYKNDLDKVLIAINNEIIQTPQTSKFYIILGIGSIKEKISSNVQPVINNIFNNVNNIKNANFIFVDTYKSYKNLKIEEWYQNNVDNTSGIWLGKDIGGQIIINIEDLSLDDRKIDFPYMAFVIENGKKTIIKHIVDEEGENEK